MKTKKIFWGLFFIAAAVLIILNQIGAFGVFHWNLWNLLITIIFIPVIITGIYHRHFFPFFFGIAFVLIFNAKPLGIQTLVPWTVLAAALLLSIGFSVLIKPRKGWHNFHQDYSRSYHHGEYETVDHVDVDGNEVNCRVSMGGSSKYLHADNLRTAHFDCSLGYLKVYFDNAALHPDGATAYVDCSLGSMELFIPRSWNVQLNVETSLGDTSEKGHPRGTEGPILVITGRVSLANLTIHYI